ncbi:cyclase family protein [Rhodococcus sp. NPDC057529]|uniref:cyclase family protein n=1 Tax=Rhodococcus sp. NPDC057529 TaxID=3346158 RepID=UPI00366EF735
MCSPRIMTHVYRTIENRAAPMSRRSLLGAVGAAALGAAVAPATASAAPASNASILDLTHVLTPGFPVWPGAQQFAMRPVARIGDAATPLGSVGIGAPSVFSKNELRYDEHTGTHVDAPAHASVNGLTVEQIPPRDLVVPLVVVDISLRARADNDTLLTRQDVLDWESDHGPLPDRCVVAMNSGWDVRAAQPPTFTNQDVTGVQHTPGFDPGAVEFLVRERDIVALGTDTLSIDAGRSTTYGAHLAALGAGKYAVEALANLSQVPPSGATVAVGAPAHAGGSGGPCRTLAWF